MRILLFILFFLSLTGCGGGGSSDSTNTDITPPPIDPIDPPITFQTIAGSVIDGPVIGAVVCLDSDSDLSCDGELYSTTTDENGVYSLDIPTDADTNLNLISIGGVDAYTSKAVPTAFALKLHYLNPTDPAANYITPVSTLVSALYESDPTNVLSYFTTYLHINPLDDNDAFLVNQEVLLAYAFYNAEQVELLNPTISLWDAAEILTRDCAFQCRINTPSNYSDNYNYLYSAVRDRIYIGEEQAIVQNFLVQAIEGLNKTGVTGLSNVLVQKVMTDHKSITLDAPTVTSSVQANYINLTWPAVTGATEYQVAGYTTRNNYFTIPIPFTYTDGTLLTLRVTAENGVQVSPESTVEVRARGITNARPPYFTNIAASKGESQINVCFDFPDIDFSYLVGTNQFYYTAYLYIKDSDKGFRVTNRLDIDYDPAVIDNRYCFSPLNLRTTKPVEFKIESHLRDRENNHYWATMPTNDFGYASANVDNTLKLAVYGADSTATLVWSNFANTREYVVYLSESPNMDNRNELFRSYSTTTEFGLPYLILQDNYYLQIDAILNDGSSQSSNIVAYSGFKNRTVIPSGVDNSTVNQYILTLQPPFPTRNLTQSVYAVFAINNPLPNTFSPTFEVLPLDVNGVATKFITTDYSDSLKATYFELGNAWEGWAFGEQYIYSQGFYETITPDYNSVADDDHDNVVNSDDICLQTPLGQIVDINGCSALELSDSDSDSVLNYLDLCSATPVGYSVDSDGCAAYQLNDFDNDNVDNTADICPNDSWDGLVVDYSTSSSPGCSPAEAADDDTDGIINFADACALTPINEVADGTGCSPSQVTDSDGDTVVDQYDQCPSTPVAYITSIDSFGCYSEEVDDGDNDGIVNIFDSCKNTPASLIALADGCAFDEVNDDDSDGVADYYDECPATQTGIDVLKNGCSDAIKPDVNFIACGRPVIAQPEYLLEWEKQTAYDGYEVTNFYVTRDYVDNTSISGRYPYRFEINVKPYYYKRQLAFEDTQRSYGTAKTCAFEMGAPVDMSYLLDPIKFTLSDYNIDEMASSTAQTAAELPQQSIDTPMDNEAHMFVFTYNGYWWGAGPMQSVWSGYDSAEEVIAKVKGATCAQPRHYVNNVTALTNNGNYVTGTFFYCGKPLDNPGENLDILKLYNFTSGL